MLQRKLFNSPSLGTALLYQPVLLAFLLLASFTTATAQEDKGKAETAEKGVYKGKTRRGMRHGKGVCTWADGSRYEGMWRYGAMHGQGTFTYNGYKYKGDWQNGKKQGRGELIYPDGTVYSGEFRDDKIQGYGKMTFPDGSYHEGYFRNGQSNGYGKHVWATGSQYVGEWKDDKMHGNGTLVLADGTVKQGEFKNNEYVPCECGLLPTLQDSWKSADGVFVAKVVSLYSSEYDKFDEIILQIEQLWKGDFGYNRKVFLKAGYTSCDEVFYEGETYLVFAKQLKDGTYFTTKCTPTKPLLEAAWEVQQLNDIVPCKQESSGRVILPSSEADFVCGCDGVTYRNPGKAEKAGITSWKSGKCKEDQ